MDWSTVGLWVILGITVPALGLATLLTVVVLCAMRGATTADRIEVLRAAAPLAREWLRHPILSLRRLPNVSVNAPTDPGLPQISEGEDVAEKRTT